MDWKHLKPPANSSIWPVSAGFLTGVALLLVIWMLGPDRSGEEMSPPPRSSLDAAPAEVIAAPRPGGGSVTRPAVRDEVGVLLPPRSEAADLTRRLQKGEVPPARRAARETSSPRPQIAVIIDDMGFDRVNSARAVRLPAAVTLAYLPYAPDVRRQVRHARLRGHDVMLHLPMEARDHANRPGRNVLAVAGSTDALREHLSRMLGRFSGYIGVNNHMGSRFTSDAARMKLVLSELKRRGLFFVDSRTSGRSVGEAAAIAVGLPYAVRDVFLDHEADPDAIRARIRETEAIARETGNAVAIGHPRPATMNLVTPWLARLGERGFDLVPVVRLLKRPDGKRLARSGVAE